MRFRKFDLNLLVALDALLTERSVTRAAARLSLSPSATSDALARLRDYFGDPLLVSVGRRLEPTALAESLQHPVRELLVQADHTISALPAFDPSTSDRTFRIFVSDYTQMVLGPGLMALLQESRCSARIDFLPQVAQPQRDLERGEADLLVLPEGLISPDHPHETLFKDDFACVVWAGSALARGTLTHERYLAAGHVVMRPSETGPGSSYEDWFVRRLGVQRRVEVTTYGFATAAPLVVGTERVATLHASLARLLCGTWPLVARPSPIPIPPMTQTIQWHRSRTRDPGLEWMRMRFREAASKLNSTA